MTLASRLEIPLSKAQYLFNRASKPGEGGDKQNFWRSELGFDSPEAIQDAILAAKFRTSHPRRTEIFCRNDRC